MTDEGDSPDREIRERMRAAVRRAVGRIGGVRHASGMSLVALLAAGALAPVVGAGVALGPVALAAMGVAGSVGAEILADVVNRALGAFSGDDRTEPPTEEEIVRELAIRLEAALDGADASGAALRETVSTLLRELGATQVVLEQLAGSSERTRMAIAEGLAGLGDRFDEFAFLGEDIRRATWTIDASLREHRAEFRAESERLREQSRVLAQIRDQLRGESREAPDGWAGCPYLGLVPFTQREARVFYGRRELTLRLRQTLAERLTDHGLLLVTGPSGAGKSSLLRAGLLPALTGDVLAPGSGRWPCRVITPTGGPLRELAAHLADLSGRTAGSVLASLEQDPAEAARLAAEGVRAATDPAAASGEETGTAARLVLIVDQFEELFTLAGQDQAEQAAFVAALDAMTTTETGPACQPAALVAVAVRGDFLDQALAHPAVARAQEAGTFTVGPMTEAELRDAVLGPAAEAGTQVEPGLVDEVVREARARSDAIALDVGALPLVSQVMAATWENREADLLTLVAYRRAGGLADAVNRSAQAAYQSLDERRQAIARALFLRLTLVTADGRVARRPSSRAELYRVSDAPDADVDTVIERFAARRLLILTRDTVAISHDVLLRTWNDLQGWLGDDRVDHALYGQVVTDAETWDGHRRDPSYLYRPGRAAEIDAAAARWAEDPERYPPLPATADAFLEAGHRANRRGVRRTRAVIAGLTALTLAASTAGVIAVRAADTARKQHVAALSREVAAEALAADQDDPLLARKLAAAAYSVSRTPQTLAAMTSLLTEQEQDSMLVGHSGAVDSVAFSPDGTVLASGDVNGIIRLWNPVSRQAIGSPMDVHSHVPGVSGLAFSPDGRVLASADGDGTVRLWNPVTQKEIGAPLTTHAVTSIDTVAFNRTGTVLAAGDGDGRVELWDPATGKEIGRPTKVVRGTGEVESVAFSPDGTILATADQNGSVRLWNPATLKAIGAPLIPSGATGTSAVAFSPDGKVLATVSQGTLQLWDPATAHKVGPAITTGDTAAIRTVVFSLNGAALATADDAGVIRLWDRATEKEFGAPISARPYAVHQLAFDPSGTILASADGNGTLRLWNPATDTAHGAPLDIDAVAGDSPGFDRDARIFATVTPEWDVHVWSTATERRILPAMTADGDEFTNAVISDDGAFLATSTLFSNTVQLWSTGTGDKVGDPITVPRGGKSSNIIDGLLFSPDGATLGTFQNDGTVRLWNTRTHQQTGAPIKARNDFAIMNRAAFSPDGRMLAIADDGRTVRLWDTATGRQVGRPITKTAPKSDKVSPVAFDARGTMLATGDKHGTVQLWNPSTQREAAAPITVAGSEGINDVKFDPKRGLLATAGFSGSVQLWDPSTGRQVGASIASTGPNAAAKNRPGAVTQLAFNGDGTVLATVDQFGTMRFWHTTWWADPYRALCAEAGAPSKQEWSQYAPGEREPAVCR